MNEYGYTSVYRHEPDNAPSARDCWTTAYDKYIKSSLGATWNVFGIVADRIVRKQDGVVTGLTWQDNHPALTHRRDVAPQADSVWVDSYMADESPAFAFVDYDVDEADFYDDPFTDE